jgi:hypothetical protein
MVAKRWKQFKSVHEWMNQICYMPANQIVNPKQDGNFDICMTIDDLENSMLSRMMPTLKNKCHTIPLTRDT